jgi:hypothetical protein
MPKESKGTLRDAYGRSADPAERQQALMLDQLRSS